MSDLITAEEAKILASKARELNINSKRNDILNRIKQLASVGLICHSYTSHPLNWTIEDTEFFTNLGYIVEIDDFHAKINPRQSFMHVTISWE